MKHPLRIWLKANGLSVTQFCDGKPFSYPTVYKLLKGEGAFSSDTLLEISEATGGAISPAVLIDVLKAQKHSEPELPVDRRRGDRRKREGASA